MQRFHDDENFLLFVYFIREIRNEIIEQLDNLSKFFSTRSVCIWFFEISFATICKKEEKKNWKKIKFSREIYRLVIFTS